MSFSKKVWLAYRISDNFRDIIKFSLFFAISFKSQIIEYWYAEIIFCIIFIKKLLKSEKITNAEKKCYTFSQIFANFVTPENKRIYGTCIIKYLIWYFANLYTAYLVCRDIFPFIQNSKGFRGDGDLSSIKSYSRTNSGHLHFNEVWCRGLFCQAWCPEGLWCWEYRAVEGQS